MNGQQAIASGYHFTGAYERSYNKEKLQEQIKEIRKSGYKAIIVTIPDSPLSRGSIGKGYSIYAEKKYFTDRERKELEAQLKQIPNRKVSAWDGYQESLQKIDNEKIELERRLEALDL